MKRTSQSVQNDLLVYGAGVIVSALYAKKLDELERRYPIVPDATILEVVGGVIITMGTAFVRIMMTDHAEKRIEQTSAYDGFYMAAQAFVYTSLPISFWQGMRLIERNQQVIRQMTEFGTQVSDYTTPEAQNEHSYSLRDETQIGVSQG